MKIKVNNKKRELSDMAIEKAIGKIETEFNRFSNNIVSIELTVDDANGPRGGIDKECRLIVRLRKMDDVVSSVREETFTKAISSVISRARRSLSRKIQRRSTRNPNRKTSSALQFFDSDAKESTQAQEIRS